jgi:deoxyribose-phosphate aldolase
MFVEAAGNAVTKCILEVCYLTDEEIAAGCKLIEEAGIVFAKTSTGQFDGPSMEQFLVMKKTLAGSKVRLKVSGVKFPRAQNALVFIKAGAERIGTRAAVEIVEGYDTMKEIGLV